MVIASRNIKTIIQPGEGNMIDKYEHYLQKGKSKIPNSKKWWKVYVRKVESWKKWKKTHENMYTEN